VVREVARQAEAGRRARGFLISPASPITPATPLTRVRQFIDIARAAGQSGTAAAAADRTTGRAGSGTAGAQPGRGSLHATFCRVRTDLRLPCDDPAAAYLARCRGIPPQDEPPFDLVVHRWP